MRYWQHERNGRVGAFESQPNIYWVEISLEKYLVDKKYQDKLLHGEQVAEVDRERARDKKGTRKVIRAIDETVVWEETRTA